MTTTPATQPRSHPTPQSISALLKRTGFTRSDGRRTSGFAVGKIHLGEGVVRVRHYFWSMGASDAQHRAQLERYATVITAHGYAARIDNDGRRLIVTATLPEQPEADERGSYVGTALQEMAHESRSLACGETS